MGAPTALPRSGLTGMRAFTLIWIGQFVSLVGTGMSGFAMSLWAWELTGQATALALVAFFRFAPVVLLSPVAGALADRWDRRIVMMLSDVAAGLATVVLFLLSLSGNLEIWHLYVAGAFTGAFESFQFPAYSAAITMMVDKKQYARTSAMMGLADAASAIVAPIMAAALYAFLRLEGILLIDIVTFVFAVSVLLFVHIPAPRKSHEGAESRGSLLRESGYGFVYIWRRRPLLGLQLVFFGGNLLFTVVTVLLTPMILARTGNDELQLASVNAAMGIGGVLGGLIVSAWGGPQRRVHGVLSGFLFGGSIGPIILGLSQTLPGWIIGALCMMGFGPLINASNQSIWQSKVPPDVQGKVFAVRRLIAQITAPLSMLLAGPLADLVFEPAMQPDGALVPVFGGLVGSGPGAGMGLLFVLVGLLSLAMTLVAYLTPMVRQVEDRIADFDAAADA